MPDAINQALKDLKIDTDNLYREEVITDLRVATIRKQVPIKIDGSDDPARPVFFTAQTHIMTPNGAMPIQAELEATTLEAAIEVFPAAMQKALDDMIAEVRELQRQQASQIVVPGAGGVPGGAGLQMP